MTEQHNHEHRPTGFFRSRSGIVFIAFLAIAAVLLWQEHRAHLLSFAPYLLLLACPLLHLFMHGGHGGHGGHSSKETDQ